MSGCNWAAWAWTTAASVLLRAWRLCSSRTRASSSWRLAGEHLALAGGDVAAQRLELGRRLAISRRAVVPILHRDVARGRQPREPLVVQPRVFLERGQSGDLCSLRGEQFLLLPVDLPARLDLHLRRPRRPLGLAPPCAGTVEQGRADPGGPAARSRLAARTSACALRRSASTRSTSSWNGTGSSCASGAPAATIMLSSAYNATTWPPTSEETGVMFPTT